VCVWCCRDCSRMARLIANQPLYEERSGETESLFWSYGMQDISDLSVKQSVRAHSGRKYKIALKAGK